MTNEAASVRAAGEQLSFTLGHCVRCQASRAHLKCLRSLHSFDHTAPRDVSRVRPAPSVASGRLRARLEASGQLRLSDQTHPRCDFHSAEPKQTGGPRTPLDRVSLTTGRFSDSLHYNTFQNMPAQPAKGKKKKKSPQTVVW